MSVQPGDRLPPMRVDAVTPERMRTTAAILRDPTPIHWDRDATRALGFGGRLLNQTPLNMGYVINMVQAWAGAGSLRRIRAEFPQPVLDGDAVTARGEVVEVTAVAGETIARCAVELVDDDGAVHLAATAWVAVAPADG